MHTLHAMLQMWMALFLLHDCTNRSVAKHFCLLMPGASHKWIDGWMDAWMDERIDRWMEEKKERSIQAYHRQPCLYASSLPYSPGPVCSFGVVRGGGGTGMSMAFDKHNTSLLRQQPKDMTVHGTYCAVFGV